MVIRHSVMRMQSHPSGNDQKGAQDENQWQREGLHAFMLACSLRKANGSPPASPYVPLDGVLDAPGINLVTGARLLPLLCLAASSTGRRLAMKPASRRRRLRRAPRRYWTPPSPETVPVPVNISRRNSERDVYGGLMGSIYRMLRQVGSKLRAIWARRVTVVVVVRTVYIARPLSLALRRHRISGPEAAAFGQLSLF